MTTIADLMGWAGYLLIMYALPKLASQDKKVALRGWWAELLATFLCLTMGLLSGLTSVIIFNLIFAAMCWRSIQDIRNRT